MGHTIRRPRPALVPITSDEPWVRGLKGVTLPDVLVRVIDPSIGETSKGKRRRGALPAGVLIARRGAMLFTHFGMSGPAVLDVSRAVTGRRRSTDTHYYRRFFAGCDRVRAGGEVSECRDD